MQHSFQGIYCTFCPISIVPSFSYSSRSGIVDKIMEELYWPLSGSPNSVFSLLRLCHWPRKLFSGSPSTWLLPFQVTAQRPLPLGNPSLTTHPLGCPHLHMHPSMLPVLLPVFLFTISGVTSLFFLCVLVYFLFLSLRYMLHEVRNLVCLAYHIIPST